MNATNHFTGSTTFHDHQTGLLHFCGFTLQSGAAPLSVTVTATNIRSGQQESRSFWNEAECDALVALMVLLRSVGDAFNFSRDDHPVSEPCGDCNGRGGSLDDDGKWLECQVCDGKGMR